MLDHLSSLWYLVVSKKSDARGQRLTQWHLGIERRGQPRRPGCRQGLIGDDVHGVHPVDVSRDGVERGMGGHRFRRVSPEVLAAALGRVDAVLHPRLHLLFVEDGVQTERDHRHLGYSANERLRLLLGKPLGQAVGVLGIARVVFVDREIVVARHR